MMYVEYKQRCADRRFQLGDVFMWSEGDYTVFNLGTQRSWRTKAELNAIEKATRAMTRIAETRAIAQIGLPRIGAGLGGLAWRDVRSLLKNVGGESTVDVIVFEKFNPNLA